MNEDLDAILAEQYHTTKRSLKTVARLRRVLINEQQLANEVEARIHLRMQFFESMIRDKSLLHKKHKKKKTKQQDLITRNPVFEWYRNVIFVSTFGYKMFMDSFTGYMSYFKKGKNE